jgi:hypothetical protein
MVRRLLIAKIVNARKMNAWGNQLPQARLHSRPLEGESVSASEVPYFFAFFFFDFLKPTLPALGS